MSLPQDPFMLYSMVNMKLRDEYRSLGELCASMNIDEKELRKKLANAGFMYDPHLNQFR